jgi:hypothetical protein
MFQWKTISKLTFESLGSTCLASSNGLNDQRDQIADYKDDRIAERMDERVFRSENRNDSAQEDVVARGHERWRDDQTRDLHDERCFIDDVGSSGGGVPVFGDGGPETA